MKIAQAIMVITIVFCTVSEEGWAAPRVLELMQKMEAAEELDVDITVKIKLTQYKPDEGIQELEAVFYRRDRDDAFLIVMVAPNHRKGNGYLRIENKMWMYRRNTRTFQMMTRDQSIAGTNVKAGDVEKVKFTDLFEPALGENGSEILAEETLGKAKIPVFRFEVKGKVKDVKYPKVIYWVRQDNFLKLKEETYSLSGTHMETNYFSKYTMFHKGKYLAIQRVYLDKFVKKGEKTIVEISDISLEKVDDAIFTKAYLENLSK